MNKMQKKIMLGMAALIVAALIFPPYKIYGLGTSSLAIIDTGYAVIIALPDKATIDILTLLVEWIAICLVGFLLIKILENDKQ